MDKFGHPSLSSHTSITELSVHVTYGRDSVLQWHCDTLYTLVMWMASCLHIMVKKGILKVTHREVEVAPDWTQHCGVYLNWLTTRQQQTGTKVWFRWLPSLIFKDFSRSVRICCIYRQTGRRRLLNHNGANRPVPGNPVVC